MRIAKSIPLFFAGIIVVCLSQNAKAAPLIPIQIRLSASSQDKLYEINNDKVRRGPPGGGDTTISRSTVTNTLIRNADLIRMLVNAFNTNLPADARLGLSGDKFEPTLFKFVVVDSTGSNVLLDASSVMSINCYPTLNVGKQIFSRTTGTNTGADEEIYSSAVDIFYYDGMKATTDGTQNSFSINGILTEHYSANLGTGSAREVLSIQCTGRGTIRNTPCLLKGSINGVISTR